MTETFTQRPRFNLETLQSISFSTGDAETTIAEYRVKHNGKICTRYSQFEDLTHAEREAALAFILKYGKGQRITRKGKPRGRAITGTKPGAGKHPAPFDLEKIEFEPVDIDSLSPTDPAAVLDAEPKNTEKQRKNTEKS